MNKIVYVPVEIRARELEARALLAREMVRRGWQVVIGRADVLHLVIADLPPGVYLSKNLGRAKAELNRSIHASGHRLVLQDEEAGIVFSNFETFWKRRFDETQLGLLDAIFLWSRGQLEYVRSLVSPADARRFHFTGSPRLDMMRKPLAHALETGARQLQAEHGHYILLSSNFSINLPGGLDRLRTLLKSSLAEAASDSEIEAYLECERQSLAHYMEAIPYVARQLGARIVIRPHPQEKPGAWSGIADGTNVVVDSRGTLAAAIAGAKGVIHHGCTGSIEANLVGVPSVYYDESNLSTKCPKLFQDVSVAMSEVACSADDVVVACRGFLAKDGAPSPLAGKAERMFFPDARSAAQNVAHEIDQLAGLEAQTIDRATVRGAFLRSMFKRPRQGAGVVDRMVSPTRRPGSRIIHGKCPSVHQSDVGRVMGEMARVTGVPIGRAEQLFWNIVVVS